LTTASVSFRHPFLEYLSLIGNRIYSMKLEHSAVDREWQGLWPRNYARIYYRKPTDGSMWRDFCSSMRLSVA
jgi:hypothetical protein